MSVPLVQKISSTKRLIILVTDFLVAGLPTMGSSSFSYEVSASVYTRDLVEMLLVSFHCVQFL